MDTTAFSYLLENVVLLFAVMAIFGFVLSKEFTWPNYIKKILAGLTLGVIGITIMSHPWKLSPGIVFDTRSVLISITGLFFGSIPTIVAVLMTAAYRIYLGGSGVVAGISVILTSAAIGLGWRNLRKGKEDQIKALELYRFGILVHVVMLLMMLWLPRDNRFDVIRQISLPVLLIYPGITVFIGILISNQYKSLTLSHKLTDSEQRLRLSNELANVAVWEYNFKTNSMSRSENHDLLYGLEWQEKWEFETFLNATHPEDRDYSDKIIQKSAAPGGPDEYRFDFRVVYPDQSIHWLMVRGKVIERNKQGQGLIVRGSLIDITERKEAEEKLRKERNFSDTLLESLPGVFYLYDEKRSFWRWNQAFEKVTGYTGAEIKTMNPLDFFVGDEKELLAERIQDVFDTRYSAVEADFVSKDGQHTPYFFTGQRITLDGQLCLLGVGIDISDRKKAEQTLKESEERLALVMEGSQLGYWDWNMETGDVQRNVRWAEMLGYTLPEIEFNVKQWTDLHHPDDKEAAWKSIQDHLEGRTPVHRIEYRMLAKDGSYKWILDQAKVVQRNPQGEPLRMSGTHTDITHLKEAEKSLREAKERFQQAFHNSPIGINFFSLDDNRSIDINDTFLEIIGYSREEVIGQSAAELNLFPDVETRKAWMSELAQTGRVQNRETKIRRKSGELRDVLASLVLTTINDEKNVLVVANDITAQKHAEREVLHLNERITLATRSARMGIWDWDIEKNQLVWDDQMYQLYGIKKGEFSGAYEAWDKSLHPDDKAHAEEETQMALHGEKEYDTEFRIILSDGSIKHIKANAIVFTNPQGAATRMVGVNYDITGQKNAEADILQSEERFSKAFHASPAALTITRIADGKFIDANQSFYDIFEFSPEEVIEHTSTELKMWAPDERKKIIKKQLETGGLRNAELIAHAKSGHPVNVLFSSQPLIINDESCHITTMINITERKQAEADREKLIARLADVQEEERRKLSQELHDRVGQSLTTLSINLKLIRSRIGKETLEQTSERFNATQELLAELSDQTRDVMAELHPPVLDDFGLAAALRWYAERLEEQTALAITVEGEMISPRIRPASAIGLYRIAQEAITNTLKHASATKARIIIESLPATVKMTIQDNGKGFDLQENLRTPKLSWGISLLYERARMLGGELIITSTPENGTTIEVNIPR